MFPNILARVTSKLPSQQQVRFARKTFRYKFAYGIQPIVGDEEYKKAVEEDVIEDLRFEPVRFAHITDTCSVLYDKDYNRFTKYVMKGGRRELADDLMHKTFYTIKTIQYTRKRRMEEKEAKPEGKKESKAIDGDEAEQVEMDPLVIFKKALKNAEPVVITRKVKRGGATYQVPYPLSAKESEYFATKWLIKAVLERPKPRIKPFEEVMAQELIDAAENRGKVIKRKDDIHKLADANKAYAHYRWG